jgi:hypothetical protein
VQPSALRASAMGNESITARKPRLLGLEPARMKNRRRDSAAGTIC